MPLPASDGLLPSKAHIKASPNSDHNTGHAVDLTHDPHNGIDCGDIYEKLKADGLNAIVTMDNASANTFYIPTDATYAFPTGTTLLVYMKGAGVTTITATTPATTTVSSAGAAAGSPVLARYKSAACIKIAANSWIVVGAIA